MVQREAAAFGWVFPFCRVILRRPVERKRSRRYKRQEFMCQTLPILEHRPKCPVCLLLRRWRESNGVYGLEAMSRSEEHTSELQSRLHLECRLLLEKKNARELAENSRIPLGHGITGTAAATAHSVRVSDTSKDPRYINAIDSVRSELALPLMQQGTCVGVLDIQSRHLDYFTKDQQNILTLLASRLAVAIENARLFQKVRTQAEDRKSTRLNSSHGYISYAVFCLKKKKTH